VKELIRTILKEYIEKDNIILEEIFLPEDFFDFVLNEGKTTIEIPRGLEKTLNDYIKEKFNWPPNVNSVWCSDIREKENLEKNITVRSCNKKFTFDISKHWLKRLFRADEPEHKKGGKWENKKIKNPETKEGIDLFFSSKEKINDFIVNSKNWLTNERKYVLLSKNDYSQIIGIIKEKKGEFKIEFITQIKGERFFDTPELKKTTYI
jgi:hypothetical protein